MVLNLTPVAGAESVAEGADAADPVVTLTVLLRPRHHAYLVARAAMHGETPERHLETILRQFRAHYDNMRPEFNPGSPEPGGGVVMRRL